MRPNGIGRRANPPITPADDVESEGTGGGMQSDQPWRRPAPNDAVVISIARQARQDAGSTPCPAPTAPHIAHSTRGLHGAICFWLPPILIRDRMFALESRLQQVLPYFLSQARPDLLRRAGDLNACVG